MQNQEYYLDYIISYLSKKKTKSFFSPTIQACMNHS